MELEPSRGSTQMSLGDTIIGKNLFLPVSPGVLIPIGVFTAVFIE